MGIRTVMIEEKAPKRQRVLVDRVSELPEFFLHMILSVLDTKEACRASVLSKSWYEAWVSIPVLDFRSVYMTNWHRSWCYESQSYDTEFAHKFAGFVDKTMQRYFKHKHRIKKLNVELPKIDEKLEPLVDKWIEIAVESHVEELNIKILLEKSPGYRLPEILFCAKSLKVLKCEKVNLPYYKTLNLISLESLSLVLETLNRDMLQRIVSLCPLIDLDITSGNLEQISLPWITKANIKESPLRKFVYSEFSDLAEYPLWQWNLNVGALRNLRNVNILNADITDDIVSELASGLVALESLVLNRCSLLSCIKVSSISLKEFYIIEVPELEEATIDAPNLLEFWYNCDVYSSVALISAQDQCNTQFCPWTDSIDTSWFIGLKEFLTETNIFKYLVMDLSQCSGVRVMFEEDELNTTEEQAVTGTPYKLSELKLRETPSWSYDGTSITALLDGLFWSCHPDILSIATSFKDNTDQIILRILKEKVQCWKHPLESIEVEGADVSALLSTSPAKFEIKFRLSWKSFHSETI